MTDQPTRDQRYATLASQLEEAGLAERFTDAVGTEHIRLTPEGEMVARQLAMNDDAGLDALVTEALLEEQGELSDS